MDGGALGQPPGSVSKRDLAAQRDEILTRIAQAIIVPADELVPIRAPIVILQGDAHNAYSVIEQHLTPEVLAGSERFWRLARNTKRPPLDTWRPRVNGVQLKALQSVRLPSSHEEWDHLQGVLEGLAAAFKPGCTPQVLVQDLMEMTDQCALWWESRAAGVKRPPSRPSSAADHAPKRLLHTSHSYSSPLGMQSLAMQPQSLAADELTPVKQQLSDPGQHHSGIPGLQGFDVSGVFNNMVMSPDGGRSGSGSLPPQLQFMQYSPQNSGGGGSGQASQFTTPQHGMQLREQQQPQQQQQQQQPQQQQQQQPHQQFQFLPHQQGQPLQEAQQQSQQPHPAVPFQQLLPADSGDADFSPAAGSTQERQRSQPHTTLEELLSPAGGIPADQHPQVMAIIEELEKCTICLDVGGTRVTTTAATLAHVEGSLLWKLVLSHLNQSSPRNDPERIMIDRDGLVFEHVMRYLRAMRHQEELPPLPTSTDTLAQLVQDATFYALPALAQRAKEELERRRAADSLLRRHRLSIDIRIDDPARGTVTRCEFEADMPVPGN